MNENPDIAIKNGKILRYGYTTGSCATAAVSAAVYMLLTQKAVESMEIRLPNGDVAIFVIENISYDNCKSSCSVKKNAGDDPDVTNGIDIFAECTFADKTILLAGEGIGVVTSKGLACKIGESAINPIPKKMILESVKSICESHNYTKGIKIMLSVPKGVEVAKKTFNQRLGIIGGISILGTTGIVEPMSDKALIDTTKILINQYKLYEPDNIVITPGNYGMDFCKNTLKLDITKIIKYSNFIGETLDYIAYKRFKRILLVGHVGKLLKLAGAIMNTHSNMADCRMEILTAHAAIKGAKHDLLIKIMESNTTDEAIEYMDSANITNEVFDSIMQKIMFNLNYRLKNNVEISVIIFTKNRIIVKSDNVDYSI